MRSFVRKTITLINDKWNDPVWSKVISAVILTVGGAILGLLWVVVKSLFDKQSLLNGWQSLLIYLNEEQTISGKRIFFLLTSILALVLLLPLFKEIYRIVSGQVNIAETAVEDDDELKSIHDRSTVFFDYRIADAFPGLRGLKWYTGMQAVSRLEILLKKPLRFAPGNEINDPIWWFRGGRNSSIKKCRAESKSKILVDHHEYIIDKIAVYRDDHTEKSFIYVQSKADSPVGVYKYTKEDVRRNLENFGFHREEFAIVNSKHPVTREQFDDGSAEVNGKVIERKSSELRTRYLTKYNFIIAAKQSPVNSQEFDRDSKELLDGLLSGTHSFDELFEFIQSLNESICK